MRDPYKLVVVFDDDRIMIFDDVVDFKHFINDRVWLVETNGYDKAAYVIDRNVIFIGPKYVWDKIQTKAEKDDENNPPLPRYHDYIMGRCPKPDELTCPAFRKYD